MWKQILRIPDLGALAGAYTGLPRGGRMILLALLLALPLSLGVIGIAVALVP